MPELRKGIEITTEFDDCIPPEEPNDEPFNPPDDWYTAEPEVAYTMGDEDEEKREAFLKAEEEQWKATIAAAEQAVQIRNEQTFRIEPKNASVTTAELEGTPVPAAKEGETPLWWDGKKVRNTKFISEYLSNHPYKSIDHNFYSYDGVVDREDIVQDIFNTIYPYVENGTLSTAFDLTNNLAMLCRDKRLEPDPTMVHIENGTMDLLGRVFRRDKMFCRNRLPVKYTAKSNKHPMMWCAFLEGLLYPEDIPTLQEYMGYCLIPTTRAQKMLMIIGKGGEGKSCIGKVLKRMLGSNMLTSSIQKIEENRFARADLENKLVMLDDDLNMSALKTTNMIKTIVTADGPMDLERKGEQSYQGTLYSRFICLGNGNLQSLYDHSRGFFRRQIILTTRDKPAGRKDDPYWGDKLCTEIDDIFAWCMEGLTRLRDNNFQFTLSERTQGNLEEAISDSVNIVDFLKSTGYVKFGSDETIASKDLYYVYKQWCDDNGLISLSSQTLTRYLSQHKEEIGIEMLKNLPRSGKYVRGYKGIGQASDI